MKHKGNLTLEQLKKIVDKLYEKAHKEYMLPQDIDVGIKKTQPRTYYGIKSIKFDLLFDCLNIEIELCD